MTEPTAPTGGTGPHGALPERALRRLLAIAHGDAAGDAAAAPRAPAVPERYRIVRELGRGGMGIVYEAWDAQLDRRCALKVIGAAAGAGDELRRRLAREALAAARLRHPNIAAVYDATPDCISMQLIDGAPIATAAASAASTERRLVVRLVRDAALALQHAHEQGIVHRDVKPSNLLVEGDTVFVVDFGLAKAIAGDDAASLSGSVVGTPAYMPPEQALGRSSEVDARSDVYALGATLHHCLCGQPPFAADDLPTLLRAIVDDEPRPRLHDRDLELVLRTCLQKEPGQRYPTAQALADDLQRWLDEEPVRAAPPPLGHRLRKLLRRHGRLLRAAGMAAAAAVLLTGLVLVPAWLRESSARQAASDAVALSDRAAAVLQDAAVFLRLGDFASGHAALDDCIATARAFLDAHEVPRVRHLLSRLLQARGRPGEALVELERALAVDPALGEARFQRGLLLVALSEPTIAQLAQARADLQAPVGAHPVLTDLELLFGRAELDRLRGDFDGAAAQLREVLVYEPTHVGARRSLAQCALATGDDDLARYWSASAVDLQRGFGPFYRQREERSLPTSIFGLDGALCDLGPQLAEVQGQALAHRGTVQLRRALRLRQVGQPAEALAAASAAVDDHDALLVVCGEVAGAKNNRAVCLLLLARLQTAAGDSAAAATARHRAEQDLARARELDPALAEVDCNLGVLQLDAAELLQRLGRHAAARERLHAAEQALQAALERAPAGWPHARLCRERLAAAAALRDAGG